MVLPWTPAAEYLVADARQRRLYERSGIDRWIQAEFQHSSQTDGFLLNVWCELDNLALAAAALAPVSQHTGAKHS
jgi:hypothetical protein